MVLANSLCGRSGYSTDARKPSMIPPIANLKSFTALILLRNTICMPCLRQYTTLALLLHQDTNQLRVRQEDTKSILRSQGRWQQVKLRLRMWKLLRLRVRMTRARAIIHSEDRRDGFWSGRKDTAWQLLLFLRKHG